MGDESSTLMTGQNVSASVVKEVAGGLIDVFGGSLKTTSNHSSDESSNSIGLKDAIANVVQDSGSSLLQFVANLDLPGSIEEIINSPKFSALSEKFSFLDKLDIFEITQERFNELMEGIAE